MIDTFGQNFEIRDIPLSIKSYKKRVESFLADNDLRLEDVDYYAGVFMLGDEDVLLGCGGLKGNIIKCIAVSEELRDTGMGAKLISHLYLKAVSNGENNVRVFTKPKNEGIFSSLSFRLLASCGNAVLMESGEGLKDYCNYLSSLRKDGYNGCIIMNANPFTLGHRYLIQQASKQVDNLYIIVVKEDRSVFSYRERELMIRRGVEDFDNVIVCKGSDYQISDTTFPTYFIKELSDASTSQITIDLNLFSNHIAPALNIKRRFAGSEPEDKLTCRYNELMSQILPMNGIEFTEIKRKEDNGIVISASKLRNHLYNFEFQKALALSYPFTGVSLLSFLATHSIRTELDTTPKPGLVDKKDNGAHTDMDYSLMARSIEKLQPFFYNLALYGYDNTVLSENDIRSVGLQAEKAMFDATKGVNTYKGALFSMGMVLTCAANVYKQYGKIEKDTLRTKIKETAAKFTQPQSTHGAKVLAENKVKGALSSAMEGYPFLFNECFEFIEQRKEEEFFCQKLLLFIMTELEDTNIYYRKGEQRAKQVKQEAKELLEDFSVEKLEAMNRMFIAEHISPGGSADMLSLSLFIYAVTQR